jgi:hypothetical protein
VVVHLCVVAGEKVEIVQVQVAALGGTTADTIGEFIGDRVS